MSMLPFCETLTCCTCVFLASTRMPISHMAREDTTLKSAPTWSWGTTPDRERTGKKRGTFAVRKKWAGGANL